MESLNPSLSTDVAVAPLRPVDKLYTYRVMGQAAVGQIVRIPFGKKADAEPTLGVIWALQPDHDVPSDKMKHAVVIESDIIITEALRQFLQWSAQYTLSPLGSFLRMALPISDVTRKTPEERRLRLNDIAVKAGVKMSEARQKITALLSDGRALTRTEIKKVTGVSDAVLRKMLDDGLLDEITSRIDERVAILPSAESLVLPSYSPQQQQAADRLASYVAAQAFNVSLLDGVTGSGKTEVYFAAIKQALAAGRQALVMVPEIALTAQFVERFTKRFGVAPVTWHSHLTPAQRRKHLKAIMHGQAQVILAARSGLFLPYESLGVIIIDEEHDSSYKQEEGVLYNARDLAIKRAQLEKCPIVLVSATPSLETFVNAKNGKYLWLKLPTRYAAAQMPDVAIVDMRAEKLRATQFLSAKLLQDMRATLEKGEQVMLYLNRRGYAPLTLCRTCGHRLECPRCTAWLVQHRTQGGLMCHHCGWQAPPPKNCPSCADTDSFVACGPGVERIYDEVKTHFHDKAIAILSSDTQKSMAVLADTLDKVQNRQIDILIGTQIVAKGHHFPLLTLVGVVDADLGLGGADLRAGERTFQILHQVSGRAGRGAHPGTVLLQSYMPEHRVMQTLVKGDRDGFLAVEADERAAATMPPYGRLAGIIISAKDEIKARKTAQNLADYAPPVEGIRVLGPAPAPLFKVRHIYRFRLLVKAGRDMALQKYITDWLAAVKTETGVRVQVDIDPYGFM